MILIGCLPKRTIDLPSDDTSQTYDAFHSPTLVIIRGYDDDAMEPFISRDGRFLFYNNSNEPGVNTEIHYAGRIHDTLFDYKGLLVGANSIALDAVPSMDTANTLYFVSTRSYDETLETIHCGRFTDTSLTDVELVSGVSQQRRGRINFDVEVSPDGNVLYLSDGLFTGGAVPKKANLVMAYRAGSTFVFGPNNMFAAINTTALEYAPAISVDGLEIFFTRLTPTGPIILRSTRSDISAVFGLGERVSAIQGFVEAPSLDPGERIMYYHRKDPDGRFRIYLVRR